MEKLIFACRAVAHIGRSHAMVFNLNLDPAIAEIAAHDPDHIRRLMVRKIGPAVPLVLAFGAANGRMHVHGVFAGTDTGDVERICAALVAAGGVWASARGIHYQFQYEPLPRPGLTVDGWARYLMDNVAEARAVTAAGPLWSMTNTARHVARELHADIRRLMKQGVTHAS